MKHAVVDRAWTVLLAAGIALAIILIPRWDATSQGELTQAGLLAADPPPNARLAEAPGYVALTFIAPVDPSSVTIRLLGEGGTEAPLAPARIAPDDRARVVASVERPLGSGSYIVAWSARTAEGAFLAGAYPILAGVVENPGAARVNGESPAPLAVLLRWLVFLGVAIAAGGFFWGRLMTPRSSAHAPRNVARALVMTAGALAALVAAALTPLPGSPGVETMATVLEPMPLGWWLQASAIVVLVLMCLVALAYTRSSAKAPIALSWSGLGCGLAALAGLSLASRAAFPPNALALGLEMGHQWSTALWLSGLVYLLGGWRGLGTDVARFRRVRWIGGVFLGVSIATGLTIAWLAVPSPGVLIASRYGQVLAGKSLVVLIVLVLGLFAMVATRRSHAHGASGSLGAQAALALVAAFLAASLALLALPGTVVPARLAGVDLVDVAPLDGAAFGTDRGMVHLLTQPGSSGPHTFVVRIVDARGTAIAANPAPDVQLTWASLSDATASETTLHLAPDPSGALFTGSAMLAADSWWRADVVITPPGGIATRARFWLVLPDPNVTGHGPEPPADRQARSLFERGLDSLASLRSFRFTRGVNDGAGSLAVTQAEVSAASAGLPARSSEAALDAAGNLVSEQRVIGEQSWVLGRAGEWVSAPSVPVVTPASWGTAFLDATGFQPGPREEVDGELCQIVTFRQPPGPDNSRTPAWTAWWVGLASGEVRREVTVSPGRYAITSFSDFDVPLNIEPPVAPAPADSAATPTRERSAPAATPER